MQASAQSEVITVTTLNVSEKFSIKGNGGRPVKGRDAEREQFSIESASDGNAVNTRKL